MTALAQLRSHIVLGFGSLCMLLSLQRHSLNTLASTKQIPSFQMFIWTKQVTRHLCVKVYRMVSPSVILVYSTVFLNAAIPQVNSFFIELQASKPFQMYPLQGTKTILV